MCPQLTAYKQLGLSCLPDCSTSMSAEQAVVQVCQNAREGKRGSLLMPRMLATAASILAALALDTPFGEVACSTIGSEMVFAGARAGAAAGTPAS